MKANDEADFWSLVIRDGGGRCWSWLGARDPKGYGRFRYKGERLAHRAAYVICVGPIPSGKWVLHRCDNPGCVHPRHLFVGSNLDNVADKVTKGRQSKLAGELHPLARLTTADVLAIRRRAARGERPPDIQPDYPNVKVEAIRRVIRRESWRCVV